MAARPVGVAEQARRAGHGAGESARGPAAVRRVAPLRQRLAESDPANAEWQRDLWVSYWRIANVLEQLQSPEAVTYWRRAHDTLSGLAAAGLFVSPQDQQFLEVLRAKIRR